ncbi:hypothetical protein [Azospirillum griseum]|uniref:hypothetical protein n=1 Tax=Azospirillum griseum TaxID=2496639 RepID=UPI001AEC9B5A|nr:hypothetical protein [Azospirillum griseum]
MFRMQQAKKPWEKDIVAKDALGQLADKAAQAARSFQLTPKQQRDHATAQSSLEEARRIGGPKAAAEQKLEQVERKIEDLKRMMRVMRGDPAKLAQLAREAATLAREAGRAAKEYASGVAEAAKMGVSGVGVTVGSTEITRTTTVTSLTFQQTTLTLSLRVGTGGGETTAPDVANPSQPAPIVSPTVPASEARSAATLSGGAATSSDATATAGEGEDDGLPPELSRLVHGMLSGLSGRDGLIPSGQRAGAHAAMQSLMTDNAQKMSRFKEADGFGRRVEAVVRVAKRALTEARMANELEESDRARKERKEGFKQDEKMIDGAQKEVNALRQAAFGSRVDALSLLAEGTGTAADGAATDSEDGLGGAVAGADTSTGADAATAIPTDTGASSAAVNLLA